MLLEVQGYREGLAREAFRQRIFDLGEESQELGSSCSLGPVAFNPIALTIDLLKVLIIWDIFAFLIASIPSSS